MDRDEHWDLRAFNWVYGESHLPKGGRVDLSFWYDCRRELAQLIYDVERNRNRPENNT